MTGLFGLIRDGINQGVSTRQDEFVIDPTTRSTSVHASSEHFGNPHGDSPSFFAPAIHTASDATHTASGFPGAIHTASDFPSATYTDSDFLGATHTDSDFPVGMDTASEFPGGVVSVSVCGKDGIEDVETDVMDVWMEEDWLRLFQPGPPQDLEEKVGRRNGVRVACREVCRESNAIMVNV